MFDANANLRSTFDHKQKVIKMLQLATWLFITAWSSDLELSQKIGLSLIFPSCQVITTWSVMFTLNFQRILCTSHSLEKKLQMLIFFTLMTNSYFNEGIPCRRNKKKQNLLKLKGADLIFLYLIATLRV